MYIFNLFFRRAYESEIPPLSTKELVDKGGPADLYICVVVLPSLRFPWMKGNSNFDDLIDEHLVCLHARCAIDWRGIAL